ncbi:MAG: dehydrogenase, partial [Bryobacteraceae bacterium]
MSALFRVGVSPDFYVDAKGKFEDVLESHLGSQREIEYGPMPPLESKLATPDALNQFDAVFALDVRITPESLRGVDRLALVARWGVGYNNIDVDALTQANVVLAITPRAVRRPVAEAIFAFIFALSKNMLQQDRIV